MTHDVERVLISPEATIREAIACIDAGAAQVAVVADASRRLLGLVTDGDVRRGLLAGVDLSQPVVAIMNARPVVMHDGTPRDEILRLMRTRSIHQVPIVDDAGRIVRLRTLDELLDTPHRENEVVLLAGGRGTRLMPLTNELPKPLLHVGDRPILQRIVESCREHGFTRIHIAVNYKAELIREHFGDGSEFGVAIDYIEEDEPRGTAGCLALLRDRPTAPFFVMNGDLLTTVHLKRLLDFHQEHGGAATMCVREYTHVVPYGVVQIDGHRLSSLEEKPSRTEFVNAGIYVLEPDVVDFVPADRNYDMTDALQHLGTVGRDVSVFPIREYWLDIGRHPDLEQARVDAVTFDV
jgi:dTDP-glucose pyrophosphorylase